MSAHPRRTNALIVVDVQEDFCEGGSLAVEGGNSVANMISGYLNSMMNSVAERYNVVILTRDYHSPDGDNGGHFSAEGAEPDYATTWPAHCVQGTSGADLHPSLREVARALPNKDHLFMVHKGQDRPAYSGFEGVTAEGELGKTTQEILDSVGVDHVDVVGIATDYCVKATALDSARLGYDTRVILNLTAPVSVANVDGVVEELRDAGVEVHRL